MSNINSALKSPFRIAEHPALDFANTLFCESIDFIPDGEAFLSWVKNTTGLEQAYKLALEADRLGELDVAIEHVRNLRNFLYQHLPQIQCGEAMCNTNVIEHINLELKEGINHWELKPSDKHGVLALEASYTGPRSVSAAISVTIANLLTEVSGSVIRKCENPDCTLWFRDTTKRGNRRWCSMAACGNRAKAAAHRLRAKQLQ